MFRFSAITFLAIAIPSAISFAQGRDDFYTLPKDYGVRYNYQTSNGWQIKSCRTVVENDALDYVNNKTSQGLVYMYAKGNSKEDHSTITSPIITGGCGTLSISFVRPIFGNNSSSTKNKIIFSVKIIQNDAPILEYQVSQSISDVYYQYRHQMTINVEGDFQIEIKNYHQDNSYTLYSQSTYDHVMIFDVMWTGYSASTTSTDVNIGSTGWASYCFESDVTIPDGITAYAVTAINNDVITLSAIDDGKILALEGVILKGTANTQYTFNHTTGAAAIEGNLLRGTVLRTQTYAIKNSRINDAAPYCYVLGNTDGIGFYKYTGDFIPANRACFINSTSLAAPALRFQFEEETNAISSFNDNASNSAISYDIYGRRVSDTRTGFHISNGSKKTFIR